MEIPDITISTHKFWEVVWRHNGRQEGTYHPDNPVAVKDSMWYVSDPFADKDSAQKYADFRAGQDCEAEVWEVVKMKRKVMVGRELTQNHITPQSSTGLLGTQTQ